MPENTRQIARFVDKVDTTQKNMRGRFRENRNVETQHCIKTLKTSKVT